MSGLGFRQKKGVLTSGDDPNPYGTGMWLVRFSPQDFAVSTGAFENYHMALTGPKGSLIQIWIDRNFYDITSHGDLNSWDPNEAMMLSGGNTVSLYWNTAAAPQPLVTMWIRQAMGGLL
jgi:hypothetical protein